jgi:hypothetical protein
LVTFFSGGTRSWIAGQSQLKAQRESRQVMDQMVRKIREANLIKNTSDLQSISFSSPFDNDITYSYNDTNRILYMREGAGPNEQLITNVLNFEAYYFDDKDNLKDPLTQNDQISKVRIELSLDVDNDNQADIALNSDVDLRNFGL